MKKSHGAPGSLTVHSRGGIGNQLFSLSVGLGLAMTNACALRVDSGLHRLTTRLPFHLESLIQQSPDWCGVAVSTCALSPRSFWSPRPSAPSKCDYVEPSFGYDPKLTSVGSGSCIFGYFQSSKYWDQWPAIPQEIRRRTRVLADSSSYTFRADDIVIHVRRGDYLHAQARRVHGVLGYDYYRQAIEALETTKACRRVIVVSDTDLEDKMIWREKLQRETDFVSGQSIWSDLELLAQAPSLVIANSTFSWWGGFLGSPDRRVVAPEPWFADSTINTTDLIPQHWHLMRHVFS